MKLIVAVCSKRDACMSFSTLDCHEECFHGTKIVVFYKIAMMYMLFYFYVLQHILRNVANNLYLYTKSITNNMKKFLLALVLMVPMLAFTGCGGEDKDEPNVPNQTLNVGQTFAIPADGSWSSENIYIASVEGKTLKGVRVGETVVGNGNQSFNVRVNPTITLFKDPLLSFGASRQTVKNYMNSFNAPTEDDDMLVYATIESGSVVGYSYTFEDNKLDQVLVMAQSTIASAERFAEYLSQRFIAAGEEDDIIMMISPDKTVAVGVTIKSYSGNVMYVIVYLPFTTSKTRSMDMGAIRDAINAVPGEIEKDMIPDILR